MATHRSHIYTYMYMYMYMYFACMVITCLLWYFNCIYIYKRHCTCKMYYVHVNLMFTLGMVNN